MKDVANTSWIQTIQATLDNPLAIAALVAFAIGLFAILFLKKTGAKAKLIALLLVLGGAGGYVYIFMNQTKTAPADNAKKEEPAKTEEKPAAKSEPAKEEAKPAAESAPAKEEATPAEKTETKAEEK